MKKSILITGGCGYIGSHLTFLLKEKKYPIVVADNLSTGHRENMLNDVIYEIGNIGNPHFLHDLFHKYTIETVIHLAAKISVEESNQQPNLYYEENTVNTIQLMKICSHYSVKNFIFSSTAAVYDQYARDAIKEDDPTHPSSVYGKSKYLAELALQHLARQYGISLVIYRYFNVAGHHPSLTIGNYNSFSTALIPTIARNITAGNFLVTVNGNDFDTHDGTCVRDYIHVMDIANAHVLYVECLSKFYNQQSLTLNIGYGKGLSVMEVIQYVNATFGKKILNYNIGQRRDGDITFSVANNSKIKSLGWKSILDDPYKEIIRSEILWCKKIFSPSARHVPFELIF